MPSRDGAPCQRFGQALGCALATESSGGAGILAEQGVRVGATQPQPRRMRDVTLSDPSGAVWRIAQSTA